MEEVPVHVLAIQAAMRPFHKYFETLREKEQSTVLEAMVLWRRMEGRKPQQWQGILVEMLSLALRFVSTVLLVTQEANRMRGSRERNGSTYCYSRDEL
jgi:hypothetical protein